MVPFADKAPGKQVTRTYKEIIRSSIGIEDKHGVAMGKRGDLVILEARSGHEALARQARCGSSRMVDLCPERVILLINPTYRLSLGSGSS